MGGNYWQATTEAAKIVLRHDGSGYLASKAISWDIAGNTEFKSNTSGNRIVIDPTDRVIKMINSSNKPVTELKFENTAGYQSTFKMESYLYNTSGILAYKSIIAPQAIQINDSSGNLYRGFTIGSFIMKNLPTIDPKNSGAIWRDGTNLRISIG